MNIRIECSRDLTTVNVHSCKPLLVDLTHDNNALYVLRHDDTAYRTSLSVFFNTAELLTLRRQIDEILENQRARFGCC